VTYSERATFAREGASTIENPRRGFTLSRGALVVAAWTLLAVIRTPSALLVTGLPANSATYWEWKFVEVLASLVPWMLVTPLILLVAEKLPLQRRDPWRQAMLHLPLAIGVIVSASGAGVLLTRPLFDAIPGTEIVWWARQTTISSFYAVTSYVAVLGIGYAMAYVERDKRRERLLVESRLRSLTAQLNPHFLFNTLNAISALGYEDPALADESLSRLSEILRKSLSGLPARISLEEEVALARQYADLHVMLTPDRLAITFEIEANAQSAAVPSLVLQPLIENAITHGVSRLELGGSVVLKARIIKNRLCITLINDGPVELGEVGGDRRMVNRGLGLANVRERLEVLYGDQQRFDLRYRAHGGVEVSLTIPLEPLSSSVRA
jgi:two-component system sensor histidine kinase AlgZ